MAELRRIWTPEEVEERARETHEGLPEATTTDRRPRAERASGADHAPGEEAYAEPSAEPAGASESFRVPPDPPLRPDATGQGGR